MLSSISGEWAESGDQSKRVICIAYGKDKKEIKERREGRRRERGRRTGERKGGGLENRRRNKVGGTSSHEVSLVTAENIIQC